MLADLCDLAVLLAAAAVRLIAEAAIATHGVPL